LHPCAQTDLLSHDDTDGADTNEATASSAASHARSTRLKELERPGVVQRRTLPPPAASAVYELTDYGRKLERPLLALGRWGAMSLERRETDQSLRSEWLAVAPKTFFRPEAASDLDTTVELRFDDGTFVARIERGSLLVEPSTGNGAALAPEGDKALVERLPRLFAFGVAD
jgi:hypothetical protein